MPGVAENALELRCASDVLCDEQTILANIETTSTCGFSRTCAGSCLLNQLNSQARPALGRPKVLELAREFINSPQSHRIRHFCALGMEVMDDAESLFEILRYWHATPASNRPGTFGIITANAAGLRRHARNFAENPLSWLVISLDVASVGLRSQTNENSLLLSALDLRSASGTQALGVNTLITRENLSEVVALGHRIEHKALDQWSLAPFLTPQNGRMKSTMSRDDYLRVIERVSNEFSATSMQIILDLDYATLLDLVGDGERLACGQGAWRYEYPITSQFALTALNPKLNYFLRARWDGELLSHPDFNVIGLKNGTYGTWQSGRVSRLLEDFEHQKNSQLIEQE